MIRTSNLRIFFFDFDGTLSPLVDGAYAIDGPESLAQAVKLVVY
ncbi:hypothetical protein [Geobacter sp.]|nr:hypothetical protein [Geobacter sp.]